MNDKKSKAKYAQNRLLGATPFFKNPVIYLDGIATMIEPETPFPAIESFHSVF